MDEIELTVSLFIRSHETTNRLYSTLIQRLKSDIEKLGELSTEDRIFLIGILGNLKTKQIL